MGRVIIVIMVILLAVSLSAGELSTKIDRFEHNRFYFNFGTEKLIFAGHKFQIIKNSDTLYSGLIENSLYGVSVSFPVDDTTLNFDLKKIYAQIKTADIDRDNPISIDCDIDIYKGLCAELDKNDDSTNSFNFANQHSSLINNQKAEIKISYNKPTGENYLESEAPFIAVLIPNLSKIINKKNYLSSSLYYRFNPDKLSYMFDGDSPAPFDCFFKSDTSCKRDYIYNHDRGKSLLKFLEPYPKELTIAVESKNLEKAALYFADVLSRDRIKLNITTDEMNADLILKFFPILNNDRSFGIKKIIDYLKQFSISDEKKLEALNICEVYLLTINELVVDDIKLYYYKLIDYSLKYDLGLFPLFRPQLYTENSDNILNLTIDQNGLIDKNSIIKIEQPTKMAGDR